MPAQGPADERELLFLVAPSRRSLDSLTSPWRIRPVEHVVTRDQLDLELKRIHRDQSERLVSVVPNDDDTYTIRTETLAEPGLEIR